MLRSPKLATLKTLDLNVPQLPGNPRHCEQGAEVTVSAFAEEFPLLALRTTTTFGTRRVWFDGLGF